jgi:hypothetical protein
MDGRHEDGDRCVRWLGHTLTPTRGLWKATPFGVWLSCVLNLYCCNINEKQILVFGSNIITFIVICE